MILAVVDEEEFERISGVFENGLRGALQPMSVQPHLPVDVGPKRLYQADVRRRPKIAAWGTEIGVS